MKVTVIGIGNPIATDDGVGIRALGELRNVLGDGRVSFAQSERGGLDLLDLLEGHRAAFIIDAALTGIKPPGTITSFNIRRPFAVEPLPSLHTMGLRTILAFGTAMGIHLPREITVCTVEARDIGTCHEGCTPEVESAIQGLTEMLVRELRKLLPDLISASFEPHDVKQPILDTISMECV